MAIWTIRHPNMLVRWAKRGLGIWSARRPVKLPSVNNSSAVNIFSFIASRHQVITGGAILYAYRLFSNHSNFLKNLAIFLANNSCTPRL